MTELILKNSVSKQKLDAAVYLLKMLNMDVEVKKSIQKRAVKKDPFAEVRGIWADRNIDAKTLRKQAWEIKHFY